MPFAMHIQAQKKAGKGAAEVIEGLHKIVHKFMWQFLDFTGQQPAKIIYFRDGVGEGQFQEVNTSDHSDRQEKSEIVHSFNYSFFYFATGSSNRIDCYKKSL